MRFILFCLCFLFSSLISASVYTWVDSAGVQHFSVEKQKDAVLLVNNAPKSALNPLRTPVSMVNHVAKYQKLAIIMPQNEETLRYLDGKVCVNVALEPKLQKGDALILSYDGAPAVVAQADGSFVIPNVERGEHKLQALVKDSSGRVLLSSDSVTFYMRQPTMSGN
ncbi:MAG: DUF4124 domain-containing protein [Gammaproteobacteria bacterium]